MKRFVYQTIFAAALIGAIATNDRAWAQTAAAPDQTPKRTGKTHIFSSPTARKNQPAANDKNAAAANRSAAVQTAEEINAPRSGEQTTAIAFDPAQNPGSAVQTIDANDERGERKAAPSAALAAPASLANADESASISAGVALEPLNRKTAEIRNSNLNLSEIYLVGAGDVLDVRLSNVSSKDSTLFTVLENGWLDYPLAGQPVRVDGLTIAEIAALLRSKITLYEQPELLVGIREYRSHTATLSGLVDKPGVKVLRREAIPLYALLAEAGQQAAARKVVVRRFEQPAQTIDLKNLNHDFLIKANDFIEVTADAAIDETRSPQYYFIAGMVAAGGQKEFHAGLTLTQAIFAAGGTTHKSANKITVLRQNHEGLLISSEFNLKEIKNGKVADPVLQNGDRIEINQ